MYEKLTRISQRNLDIFSEIELYSNSKKDLLKRIQKIYSSYAKGAINHQKYEEMCGKILDGKSRDEWLRYYNSYIHSMLKEIEVNNSILFSLLYADRQALRYKSRPLPSQPVLESKPQKTAETVVHMVHPLPSEPPKKPEITAPVAEKMEKSRELVFFSFLKTIFGIANKRKLKGKQVITKPVFRAPLLSLKDKGFFAFIALELRRFFGINTNSIKTQVIEEERERLDKIIDNRVPEDQKPIPEAKLQKLFRKQEQPLFERIHSQQAEQHAKEDELLKITSKAKQANAQTNQTSIFSRMMHWRIFHRIVEYFIRERVVVSEETIVPNVAEGMKFKAALQEDDSIRSTMLAKEAEKIQMLISGERPMKRSAVEFAAFVNILVKRITISIIKIFPDFFKDFYGKLRYANVRVLSNTYINLMIFFMINSFIIGFWGAFFLLYLFNGLSIALFGKAILTGIIASVVVFLIFYLNPLLIIVNRKKSINTNMPFALNHMAAAAASGITPISSFKLVSKTDEYAELSVEIRKIVNYVEIFGYDFVTAAKSVAATTPCEQFKEFLEGFISSFESGGDIKNYLKQKSDESMLSYSLERQKYNEAIATYSDVYTGILIAAPLFFVATLSLVNILGGTIGGMNIQSVIAIGIYAIVPMLNMLFMVFLQVSQPEV